MLIPLGARRTLSYVLVFLACASAGYAQAQYEILHGFPGAPGQTVAPLMEASNGEIYGVTRVGGTGGGGVVFALRPGSPAAFRIVHQLQPLEGGEPSGALIEVDGEFYGTTRSRGAADFGTVFKIKATGAFELLHTFAGTDGAKPMAALVRGGDGALYGTTSEGGPTNHGSIFKLAPNGVLTTVHFFNGGDGRTPTAPMILASDGNLYGTASQGGALETHIVPGGVIFRLTPDQIYSVVREFGELPYEEMVVGYFFPKITLGADGDIYGSASVYGGGISFFKITTGGQYTQLSQTGSLEAGGGPSNGPLVQAADGNFYGALPYGGPRSEPGGFQGTAFQLTPSGAFSLLHEFTRSEGPPFSGLIQARDGFLYGATPTGGYGNGMVFRLSSSGAFTSVHNFSSGEGEAPWTPPVGGLDGAFYGTTVKGGIANAGTIYRVTNDKTFRTLHVFTGGDGANPYAGLVLGSDGFFYGVTSAGGCAGRGTIFRISSAGAFTVLHCFSAAEGNAAFASLIQASDGNYYGTTIVGGTYNWGTVFRITPGGTFTTLTSLRQVYATNPERVTGVAYPYGSLVETSPGVFFGTALRVQGCFSCGGLFPGGGVFAAFSSGGHAALATIPGNGGFVWNWQLYSGLSLADDGYLYGTNFQGVFFRLLPQLIVTNAEIVGQGGGLGLNASTPIQESAGSFIGASLDKHTIYRVTANQFTILKALAPNEGLYPTGVGKAVEGSFYGTTYSGGPGGGGVVFRLRPE